MKNKMILTLVGLALLGTAAYAQTPLSLEEQVRQAIRLAPNYGVFDNLSFRLDGSGVTLLGEVKLPITKEQIYRRVSRLKGVGTVIDEVIVLPLSRFDDALRLRLYRSVFGTAGLQRYSQGPDPSIHIIVRGGRVVLEGVVGSEMDRNSAALAARVAGGVISLKNNLRVQG
jgi:hyperosmotically inducible protein